MTRVNPDRNKFSINVELASTLQRFGPSPSPNFKEETGRTEGLQKGKNIIFGAIVRREVWGGGRGGSMGGRWWRRRKGLKRIENGFLDRVKKLGI